MTEMKARLVDKDGNPLGTAANPLKISDHSISTATWGSITGTLSDQTDLNTALNGKASKTESDLTLYVYEDATGDADGSSKANAYTTLQAAIDAIPDVAQNVTVIVCKGSTNYLGQTTKIQKASVKSLTIQGEFYAYESCDANAVAGKVVDASADFSDFEVGDRVVCTHYSGTVGSSSIDDYFYATITEVGSGYVQTSEETKVPTTGWKYLINQTVFDGNNQTGVRILYGLQTDRIIINGISILNTPSLYSGVYLARVHATSITSCIFYNCYRGIYGAGQCNVIWPSHCAIIGATVGIQSEQNSPISALNCTLVSSPSGTTYGIYEDINGGPSEFRYSGIFGFDYALSRQHPTFIGQSGLSGCYIDSTCTYGTYGYNITLSNCTNNATTPVYNLTSGGRVEEAEFAASASQNIIINGDFSVAQRGTSFTSETWRANSDDSYLLDRWLLLSDGNDIVDVTQISGAFSRSRYALQAEVETANKKFGFCQIIEANSCIPLRGQKISVSFAAKTMTDKLIENVRVAVLEWTGTTDVVTSDVVSAWNAEGSNPTWATSWAALNTPANLALSTSEQTFKVENLTVGTSCNHLAVFVWVDDTDCAVDDILQLGEVQVVRGSVAPEFVATYDLLACLRRCQKYGGLGKTNQTVAVLGTTSATQAKGAVVWITPMAVTPTITENTSGVWNLAGSTVTGLTFSVQSLASVYVTADVASGLTAGQVVLLRTDGTAAFWAECEL